MFKKDGIGFLNKKGQFRPQINVNTRGSNESKQTKNESKPAPSITQGIPIFSSFFYWLGKALRFISKYFIILPIFLLLFFAFLYGGYNYLYRAEQGAVLYEHASVAVQETGAPLLARLGLTGIYDIIVRPEKLYTSYSFESDIEQNKENKDLGLRITDLIPIGRNIYSDQPIYIRGTIKAQSLEKPVIATVSCSLKDYDGTIEVISPTTQGGNEIKIYQGLPQTYTVGCNFPKGISVPTINENTGSKIPRIAKEAEMSVSYNFVTRASHNTYFLTKSIADSLLTKGVDPFIYYKISDPQLKSDRTVTSKTTIGPINLGIGTFDSQPFSEGTPYFFGVSLNNNLNYNGKLKKLNKLEIRLPPNMVVAGESEFGDGGTCDFYYIGNNDENGFKIYYLKNEKMDEIERQCSLDSLRKLKITPDECVNVYQSSFNFNCQLKIVQSIIGDSMYIDFIRGEADYVYETNKKTVVDITQNPGLLIS